MKSPKEINTQKSDLNKQLKNKCKAYQLAILKKVSDEKRMKIFHQVNILQNKLELLEWILN